mmetsp:Transcript_15195/g.38379  ORF Transcript_15195/g.38379 Transcript_15195/m.38379 type:complete len:245 (-) Transcript_15195:202-936(-)
MSVLPEYIVGARAVVNKFVVPIRLIPSHYIQKFWCEHERRFVSVHAQEFLHISQKVSKIDVKKSTIFRHHYVVIVPVSQAQDIRRYTISSAATNEVLHSLVVFLIFVVLFQPVSNHPVVEGSSRTSCLHRDVCCSISVKHDLKQAFLIASADAPIGGHPQVHACFSPKLVHDSDHLQGEQVLLQIVSRFQQSVDRGSSAIGIFKDKPQWQLCRVHIATLFHDEALSNKLSTERKLKFIWQLHLL